MSFSFRKRGQNTQLWWKPFAIVFNCCMRSMNGILFVNFVSSLILALVYHLTKVQAKKINGTPQMFF